MIEFFQGFSGLTLLQSISLAGVALYIGSFAAVQTGRMNGDGIGFALANVVAALLVIVGLYEAFNLSSFLIQACFVVIGMAGILRKLRARAGRRRFAGRATRFSQSVKV